MPRKYEDLTKQKFYLLKPISYLGKSKWLCQCDCGNMVTVSASNLKQKHTRSCGCLQKQIVSSNLVGQKFGKLTVIKDSGQRTSNRQILWECKCDCGNITLVRTDNLTLNHIYSCGCGKQSIGEYKIEQLLSDANIEYQKEYTFTDLISEKGGNLRFDFAILHNNKLLYLIEYDGETHSYNHPGGWNTIDKIAYQIKCDKQKNIYCQKHNIPLIRIPYTKLNTLTLEDLIYKGAFEE